MVFGADMEARDAEGATPLIGVCSSSAHDGRARLLAALDVLLECAVELDAADTGGRTALWWSASYEDSSMMRKCVHAAPIQWSRSEGRTYPCRSQPCLPPRTAHCALRLSMREGPDSTLRVASRLW